MYNSLRITIKVLIHFTNSTFNTSFLLEMKFFFLHVDTILFHFVLRSIELLFAFYYFNRYMATRNSVCRNLISITVWITLWYNWYNIKKNEFRMKTLICIRQFQTYITVITYQIRHFELLTRIYKNVSVNCHWFVTKLLNWIYC